jgi:hypothetical protein
MALKDWSPLSVDYSGHNRFWSYQRGGPGNIIIAQNRVNPKTGKFNLWSIVITGGKFTKTGGEVVGRSSGGYHETLLEKVVKTKSEAFKIAKKYMEKN